MLDPGHHVQMCNLAFERLFRYGRDELMRANLKDLITTNDLTAVLLVNNRHTSSWRIRYTVFTVEEIPVGTSQKLHASRSPIVCNRCTPPTLIGPRLAHSSIRVSHGPTTMELPIARPLLKMAGVAPLLCWFALAQQSPGALVRSLTSIVQGMEKSQSEVRAQAPYQIIREYRLFGMKSSSANADVVAQVDFDPPIGKHYSIQKWSGSARGKQIVQRVLDRETEASKGNQAQTALTRDNYDFSLLDDTVLDGRPCYVLGLKPKRKEKELVSGSAWVDKSSLLILQVEGETAKAPSWWLKSVRIKMSFGDFSGAWLQTSMEAVADVRLLGSHTLKSRTLDYRGSDMSASIKLAASRTQLRSRDLAH